MNSTRGLIAVIAGFCALGFAVMSLLYWAALATPPFNFSLTGIDLILRILIIGAIVSFSIYILSSPESVGKSVSKRSNRLTANALVAALVAVGIAVVVNMLVEGVPAARADLTAGQDFTLSPQTIRVVESLPRDVRAIAFLSQRNTQANPISLQQAEDLLKEYQSRSGSFKYEIIDPETSPADAARYGVNRYGLVILDNGLKRETADSVTERDLTSALVRLGQTQPRTVAFLTGHGERDPDGVDRNGLSAAKQDLTQNNYITLKWSLVTSPTITTDAVTVLVIAAPTQPILANELQAIGQYLDAGGRVLMLLDADPIVPANALASLRPLLAKYGVTPVQGWATDIDPQGLVSQDPRVILVTNYPPSDVTEELARNNLPTIFPLAIGLTLTPTVSNYTVSPLVQTTSSAPTAWLETDTQNLQISYNEGVDVAGPIIMGVSVEPAEATQAVTGTQTVTGTRLVVFADADFAGNNFASGATPYFNSDLFGNSVSWLAGVNELISIRPKEPSAPRTLALSAGEKNAVLLISVIGLPFVVAMFGVLNWWRRR